MDKLREEIAEYLYDCDNGIFPDRTVLIEWRLASEGNKAEYYRRANQIMALIKQAGYVKLAEDQSLPQVPEAPIYFSQEGAVGWSNGYQIAQEGMLKVGFRRIKL